MADLARSLATVALAVAATALTAPARADEKTVCSAAAGDAQSRRAEGKLRKAREHLVRCAQQSCPKVVRNDCTAWLAEVESELPSIVVRASDGKGIDLVDVQVELDRAPLVSRLDGNAVTLDPGAITLRFSAPGFTPKEMKIVVARGEKTRIVNVTLDRIGQAPAPEGARAAPGSSSGSSAVPWILLGVGGASLAAFGVLEGVAHSEYSDLEDGCGRTRSCTDGDMSPVRSKFVAAGVTLGVGLAAAGAAATWWIVSAATGPSSTGSRARPSVSFGVGPSGALVRGRF
jgi:hypothetical protein